jgi:hypothetical protein
MTDRLYARRRLVSKVRQGEVMARERIAAATRLAIEIASARPAGREGDLRR